MAAAAVQDTGTLDPRGGRVAGRCSIAAALDVLSARSAFLLLREAVWGTTKFRDFAERVGLSEAVTAGRLTELVDEGLLERENYREEGQRTRQRYRLTQKGADLLPVLMALMQWGDRWVAADGGPIEVRHRGCGAHVGVHLQCDAGHEVAYGDLERTVRPQRPPARASRATRSGSTS
jgi:DNA-binding HxlR family transcriptional regulator